MKQNYFTIHPNKRHKIKNVLQPYHIIKNQSYQEQREWYQYFKRTKQI